MEYFDILKRAFTVTNRNLLALLAQFVMWLVLGLVAVVIIVILAGMAIGTFAGLDSSTLSVDNIWGIVSSSIVLIFTGGILLAVFVLAAYILGSFVQAGIIGCLIETEKGVTKGFDTGRFFLYAKRSVFPLLWLYVLWGLIGLAVLAVLGIAAAAGIFGVLLPMKDAGNQMGAFIIAVPLFVVLFCAFVVSVFLIYSGGSIACISLVGGNRGAVSALESAYDFLEEHFWDTVLFTLLILFVTIVVNVAGEFLTLPFQFMASPESALVLLLIPLTIIKTLIQMYSGLFALAAFAVFYYDRIKPPVPVRPATAPVMHSPTPVAPPRQTASVEPVPPVDTPGDDEVQEEDELLDAGIVGDDSPDFSDWGPEPLDNHDTQDSDEPEEK